MSVELRCQFCQGDITDEGHRNGCPTQTMECDECHERFDPEEMVFVPYHRFVCRTCSDSLATAR